MSGRARGVMTNIQMEAMVGRAVIQFLFHTLKEAEIRLLMDLPSDGVDIRTLSKADQELFVRMKKRRVTQNTYASLVVLANDTDDTAPIWQLTALGLDLRMALRNGTF